MFDTSQLMAASGAADFYDHEIDGSLRFNDNDAPWLSRTLSGGNQQTWTYSCWVKRGELNASGNFLFANVTNGSDTCWLYFTSDDKINFQNYEGANQVDIKTNAVYRDTSAWYHVVAVLDTTNATSSDRARLYVNGERITSLATTTYPSQNASLKVNSGDAPFGIGGNSNYNSGSNYNLDGYLAEVNFIDGTALDADDFGEFKSGVWVPKAYEGSYGTNGFYLPFTTGGSPSVTGGNFAQITYTGTGASQNINIGFKPDLIWTKVTSKSDQHVFTDSVRGVNSQLYLDLANAAGSGTTVVTSINNDGFTVGSSPAANESGQNYIAMCWSAGGGSGSSNTDGSITSTVQASGGFSVCRYTANGTNGATFGHGLSSAPKVVLFKSVDDAENWYLSTENVTGTNGGSQRVNGFHAEGTGVMSTTAPDSSVVTLSSHGSINNSGHDMIAYCWAEVSGYQKFGTYTGNASSSGPTITTGFRPSLVITFRMSAGDYTQIHSGALDATNPVEAVFYMDVPNAAGSTSNSAVDFNSNGFQIRAADSGINGSGNTYMYWAFADASIFNPIGSDESGNANHFDVNNLANTDVVLDSPTNNFCTLNSVAPDTTGSTSHSFSEGNLKVSTSSNNWWNAFGTIGVPSSGKYYWEFCAIGSGSVDQNVGLVTTDWYRGANAGIDSQDSYSLYAASTGDAYLYTDSTSGVNKGSGWCWTWGDIVNFAIDADTGKVWYGINGTWLGSGNPVSGTNQAQTVNSTDLAKGMLPAFSGYWTGGTPVMNFGQDSSFAGNKTAQGNTDANGIGDFYYAPPSGYLALCTANLPDPVASIDPAQDGSPQDHFAPVIWTGDGTSSRNISTGFQSDFTWIKCRSLGSTDHLLFDSIRGAGAYLRSHTTSQEYSTSGMLDAFNTDGFQIGSNADVNSSGRTFASWSWKANGSGVSNTDGSITSTVSANTDAGFSIVSYTGTGTTSETVGHGLSSAPEMVIAKNRDSSLDWRVYHIGIGATKYLGLNQTIAATTDTATWDDTAPTSSVFSIANSTKVNESSSDHIAYCFHSVDGFSKFGSYTGNGSTDGPFVYTGFRPAFVICKNASTSSAWVVTDNTRSEYNVVDKVLLPHLSNAEEVGTAALDTLSNGFKIRRASSSAYNTSGSTHIYMAFAENPFKYANAR